MRNDILEQARKIAEKEKETQQKYEIMKVDFEKAKRIVDGVKDLVDEVSSKPTLTNLLTFLSNLKKLLQEVINDDL